MSADVGAAAIEAAAIEAAAIEAAAARLAAAGDSTPRFGRDPVNAPMIRNWTEAIGGSGSWDAGVAPPAMIQVWTMPGLHGVRGDDDPLGLMSAVLDEAGYTSVVATNCDQEYHRYLKLGEQLAVRSRLLDVTGPKRTALGEGWFVTTRSTWYADSGDEPVATMDFRILKFRPPAPSGGAAGVDVPSAPSIGADATSTPITSAASPTSAAPPTSAALVMRPQVSRDTEFFWAGTRIGELRIQRCAACGALRHPPGPMCPACGVASPGYVVAAGTGEVYSYVVHHHPPVPGKELPIVIALVQLPEGVRMVGELRDVKPDDVRIGLPVHVEFVRVDAELTLPMWRSAVPGTLPPRTIDVTPTFVISSALATRDFQDVHHDRDAAVTRGSKDIFLNILTTTGLVQRYVSDWAGPDAVFRAISIRLGVPCHAGDTLTFTGHVTDSVHGQQEVRVTGRCSLGDHVTARVRFELPDGAR
jgi:uncharacterized OB-fold protein